MNSLVPIIAVSPLRQRLIDEMDIRRFGRETQRNYIRDVGRFATSSKRSFRSSSVCNLIFIGKAPSV